MTILLTKDTRFAGSVVTAGTTADYADDVEADLVRRGHATYVGSVNPAGNPRGVVVEGLQANMEGAATANTLAIQTALTAGGLVQITTPGTYYVNSTLAMPSKTRLYLGVGVKLLYVSGRVTPVIKNKYAGCLMPAAQMTRASNVVTVSDVGHTRVAGDQVFLSGGSDSSFRGLVTVLSVTATAWTYASTGSNGTAGAATSFYNCIPVRQTLSGSALVATSNYVTVTESGHDKRPGMVLYIGKDGGDNFAPGMVTVTQATESTWTYKTTSASGTASGTLALSYDYDIEIDGGIIDGNRANVGTPATGSEMQLCVAWFGAVTGLRINAAIGGCPFRSVSAMNCASVTMDKQWSSFDSLVGVQFEGGGANLVVDQAIQSSAQVNTTSAQRADDYVAFSGTAIAGGGGNYDNTASPYGMTQFSGLEVRRIAPVNALNGVKITATGASCPFVGVVKIGAISGRMLDRAPSLTTGSAIKIFDDGPSLVGTIYDTIQIDGPVEWVTPTASSNAGWLHVGGASVGNAIYLRGGVAESSQVRDVQLVDTATLNVLDIDASRFIGLGTNNVNFNLAGGTLQKLAIRNSRIQVGTSQPCVYLNGASVAQIEIIDNQFHGVATATGDVIQIDSATSYAALKTLTFKGNRNLNGGNSISSIMAVAGVNGGTTDIVIDDHDVTSASGIRYTTGSGTGTFNVFLGAKVRWTATGGNNFLQVGGGTWTLYGHPGAAATLNNARLFLTGFGSPTYKSFGFTQILTAGAAPAWDLGFGNNATLSTGANATVTLGAPSNVPPVGTPCSIVITQDATGGRTVAWNAAYIFPTAFSNTGNTANKKTTVYFVSDGTALVAQGANSWY